VTQCHSDYAVRMEMKDFVSQQMRAESSKRAFSECERNVEKHLLPSKVSATSKSYNVERIEIIMILKSYL